MKEKNILKDFKKLEKIDKELTIINKKRIRLQKEKYNLKYIWGDLWLYKKYIFLKKKFKNKWFNLDNISFNSKSVVISYLCKKGFLECKIIPEDRRIYIYKCLL